jgi:glycosyltransferase involved in cell wall biosynthesis
MKRILSPRGMLHEGAFRFKRLKKSIGLQVLQIFGLFKGVTFHATDETEQKAIQNKIPGAHTVVIPNLTGDIKPDLISVTKTTGKVKLLYAGRIAPQKNVHFILELLQELPATCTVELNLAGLEDDEAYGRMCRDIVQRLKSNIHVSFLGALPHESVSDLLMNHHFLVQTSFSENFGHSVFEALSSGRPVIISDGMPWKNLREANAGFDISLQDRKAFIDALEKVAAMDQKMYNHYCQGAIDYATSAMKGNTAKLKYLELYGISR